MSSSRHVSRPRPSLSCEACRRRKVRCGREQPKCQSCQRTGETCEFNHAAYKEKAAKAKQQQPPASTIQPERSQQQQHWAEDFSTFTHQEASDGPEPAASTVEPSAFFDNSSFKDGAFIRNNSSEPMTPGGAPAPFAQSQDHERGDVSSAGARTWSSILLQGMQQPGSSHQASENSKEETRRSVQTPKRKHALSDAKSQQLELIKSDIPGSDVLGHSQPPNDMHDSLRYAVSESEAENDLLPTGYMGPGSVSRPRYVESSFWALLHGQEALADKFLDAIHGSSKTQALWNVDAVGLANLLTEIPNKAVCDVLLYSFIVGVRPVHPLVHLPTFRKAYDYFWHWCKHSDTLSPNQRLIDDPTFIPLLFAVLYCGAVAAPVSFSSSARPLRGLDMRTLVSQLRSSYLKGLKNCHHTRRPTLNTLVASLLGHGCSTQDDEAFEDLSWINMMVRIAQSMGLHREYAPVGLDPVTREMHRRVWWHLVCLDTRYAFLYGSQTCCGAEGVQWDVQMMGGATDEAISEFHTRFFSSMPTPNYTTTSAYMIFTIGRSEATRFLHGLLNRVNSCQRFNQTDLNSYLDAFKKLHIKLNALINRLPAQGVPERGFVPSRMANASMLTHESLYTDDSTEASVFSSWARITLTMFLTGTLLGLQKIFLGHPNLTSEQNEKLWTSTFQLSIGFIRHLLRIARIPAFAPYFWIFSTNIPPFQAILIILGYLQHNPSCQDAPMACYFVDEALEIFETVNPTTSFVTQHSELPSHPIDSDQEQEPAVIRLLKSMRKSLDTPMVQKPAAATPDYLQFLNSAKPLGSRNQGTTSPAPSLAHQTQHASTSSISSMNRRATPRTLPLGFDFGSFPPFTGSMSGDSAPSPDMGLDISDFEIWSSVMTQESEDLPMVGDI